MKVIAARIWNEPAVAVGFVVSLALTALLASSTSLANLTQQDIGLILAPLVTALGIRPLVTPNATAQVPPDADTATEVIHADGKVRDAS